MSEGEGSPWSFLRVGVSASPPARAGPSCPSGCPTGPGRASSLSALSLAAWKGGGGSRRCYLGFTGRELSLRRLQALGGRSSRTQKPGVRVLTTPPLICCLSHAPQNQQMHGNPVGLSLPLASHADTGSSGTCLLCPRLCWEQEMALTSQLFLFVFAG